MPPWGVTNGFGFRPYWNDQMYIKDQDGDLVPIPEKIPEVKTLSADEHDYLPPLEIPPDQVFYITGKTAKRMIQMVFRDMNHGKRLLRDVIRKKERFRRAVLKYGVTDNKAQLALLLYSVAIQRLTIWKGEKNHGNA